MHDECLYLQLSLRATLSEAGVSHFQLGSEAQMMLLPFFLRYLYSIAVLAGNVTVANYPDLVNKILQRNARARVRILTTPGRVIRRRERDRIVWGPVTKFLNRSDEEDVLCTHYKREKFELRASTNPSVENIFSHLQRRW